MDAKTKRGLERRLKAGGFSQSEAKRAISIMERHRDEEAATAKDMVGKEADGTGLTADPRTYGGRA